MIVYLMTLLLAGDVNARAIVMNPADCQALARRIAGNAAPQTIVVQCDALPMYFASVDGPPVTPSQQPPYFRQNEPKAPQ